MEGGKYGISRAYADVNNKDDKKDISAEDAVLDKFYFLLNTPLNSKYGYLFIQSYTEETIQEPFKNLIKPFFSSESSFFNIVIEPYVPKKFVEKFMEEAKIRLFNFSTITGIGDNLRDHEISVENQTFEVTINIKPKGEIKTNQTNLFAKIFSALGSKKFENRNLSELDSRIFVESGLQRRRANYDLEKEMKNIKPTIYLEDEGIEIDGDTGLPNFDQIKVLCSELLDVVKREFNEGLKVDEL